MTPLTHLRNGLQAQDIPAILLTDVAAIRWLCGFTGSFAQAVVTHEKAVFITDSRYRLQALEEVQGFEVESFSSPLRIQEVVGRILQELGVTRLGFEKSITYSTFETWTKEFAGVELVPLPDLLKAARMIKRDDEVERIRAACALSDAAAEHILRMLRPGISELDICLDLEFFIRRQGAELAFPSIVVSGPNSAKPHGKPGERLLERGDFVTLDFGAKVDGYCSDITRTFVIGQASDRHKEIYHQVLKAQEQSIQALVPGANGRDIDTMARQILDEKQLAQYFGHSLGHGLGLVVHDFGRLSSQEDQPIEVGQVWTIEPGVYIDGFGGVRIEDDVLVTEDGPAVLTRFPKSLTVLG